MSPLYYLSVWGAYLLLVLIALAGAWRLSRNWPGWLRDLGRIALIVLFFTPAAQVAGGDWLAPAFVVAILDQLQGVEGGWLRAGVNLIIAGFGGILIYFVHLLWRLKRSRH